MKKLISFIFLFSISFSVFGQNIDRQHLTPHTVFVGDNALLIISFQGQLDFFDNQNIKPRNNSPIELSPAGFEKKIDETKYSINRIVLTKSEKTQSENSFYEMTIYFTPWVTGEIRFPPYKFENGLTIYPSEIKIESILSREGQTKTLIPGKGPLLLPGTTYRILFGIIFSIILIILIIVSLCRMQKLIFTIKNIKLRINYFINKKQTIKKLSRIKAQKSSDKTKAEDIQSVLRNYLTIRFGFPFTICGSSEIYNGFNTIFQGLMSEKKEDAVESLCSIFIRTDFIRYSKNASFDPCELSGLIDISTSIICTLEETK